MNYATLSGIRRGHRELEGAFKLAAAVFGDRLEISTDSSNGRDFRSYSAYASEDVWAEYATSAWVSVENLLDYGRPKHITPQMWVWSSNFVKVSLRTDYPFNIYRHEPGSCDENGKTIRKAGLRPFSMNLSVSGGRSYGLGDWSTKREGLSVWAAKCKSEQVRNALMNAVRDADHQVSEWKRAMADMAKSMEAIK